MLDKIIEIIMTILPFLGSNRKKRKVMAQEVKDVYKRQAPTSARGKYRGAI